MYAQSNVILSVMLMMMLLVLIILILQLLIVMNIMVHELGHYLVARCFGCKLRRIQLSIFIIYRSQEGYHLRCYFRNLFTGSCDLIVPSSINKYQAIGISLGGVFFNGLSLIVCILIAIRAQGFVVILSIIYGIYAFIIIIANSISLKDNSCCDGSIAYALYIKEDALKGYIGYQIIRDKLYNYSYNELSHELFLSETDYDKCNDVNSMYGLLYIKYLVSKKRYKEAMDTIETYLCLLPFLKKDIIQAILLELVYVQLIGYLGIEVDTYIKEYGIQEFAADRIYDEMECEDIDKLRVYTAFLILHRKQDINIYDVIEKGRKSYERGDYIYGDYVFFLKEMISLKNIKVSI